MSDLIVYFFLQNAWQSDHKDDGPFPADLLKSGRNYSAVSFFVLQHKLLIYLHYVIWCHVMELLVLP